MVVLDSSALVALLVDAGQLGDWVAETVADTVITGPQLLPFEVANVLRRHQLAGKIDRSIATLAHADLVALPLKLWPYSVLADRIWELRDQVTAYDASYVALAELVGCPVITLDRRLGHAHGLACHIVLPPPALFQG
jgi:predicted nucleic acid-binding protein